MTSDTVVDLVGAELFGRPARLRIALWVASQDERFWQQLVADGAGVRPQYVKTELNHLARLGMIEAVESDDSSDRRNFYIRCPEHPLWSVMDVTRSAINALAVDAVNEAGHLRSV